MARSNLQHEPQSARPGQGEWQELRSELVALLDQVETQVARAVPGEAGYQGLSERMRDLKHQVTEIEPNPRHREALRQVQRAIDRFSDRDGALPPNPRDTLEAAIEQIRARHKQAAPTPQPETRGAPLDELAEAVEGISGRLERLEGELRTQAKGQTANVKEIAEQVGQLSHVVELLAGAVGETGQVKRLEAQIAGLARLITRDQNVDVTALTSRLDDVTATVGRLADLQVEFANRVDSPNGELKDAMRGVEDGVRTIYDRVDALEKAMTVPQVELEKFTEELQRFAAAVKAPQPQGLIELIDALNVRISDMEATGPQVGMLQADVDALRSAVVEAMEPRFAALELQIEALSDRVSEPNVGQIELQMRQLVERMDQTGEQLTSLAKLYGQPSERDGAPDFDVLAELVAQRTTAAMSGMGTPAGAAGFGDAAFDEIEKRVSRVMQAAAEAEPADENVALNTTIREVSERLARLEASLAGPKPEMAEPAPEVEPREMRILGVPVEDTFDLDVEFADDNDGDPATMMEARPSPAGDEMPANPADEAPLVDRPFAEPSPLQLALEAKNGPRLRRPEGDNEPTIELPPAPTPSLGFEFEPARPELEPETVETPSDTAPTLKPEPVVEVAAASPTVDPEPMPNRNTFIAAHRRAVRMANAAKTAPVEPAPDSLMSRAFARFQASLAAPAGPEAVAVSLPRAAKEKPKKERKPGRDKDAPKASMQEAAAPQVTAPALDDGEARIIPGEAEPAQPSFLMRHRQPILIAAAVVALACLTINLVNQRLGEEPAPTAGTSPQRVGDAALEPTPLAEQKLAPVAPAARVIPVVDSLQTASVDPAAAHGFMPAAQMQEMPKAFTAAPDLAAGGATEFASLASDVEPLPAAMESPVKVEMPPASMGPEALRKAAADGDARAQFEVAAIYTEGRAVPEDLGAAAVWYERAASQGFAPAQYRLGSLYENGRGVAKDLDVARLWYQRSAEAGNRMAMHNLAALYAGGGLGSQQFDAAARWFEEAANRGMKDSQFNLGMLYARGLGVKQDLEASYKWFALAADRGDADALKARDGIAASLEPATVQRLVDEVAEWTPQSIDLVANFAPIGTWQRNFDPGQAIANVELVKGVQKALVQLGYDVGTADGLAGPKTADAIRTFERATGMSESGSINPRLLAVLGSQPV